MTTETNTPEVWTAQETADFLKVHVKTLYALLHKRNIPGVAKVGNSYRILKEPFLEAWMRGDLTRHTKFQG